jgi:quinol monooxygenase YgiN
MVINPLRLDAGIAIDSGTVLAKEKGVVFSIIRIAPSPKQRGQAIEILRSVQDLTRPTPGCLGCWLSEEDCLHNHILYAEQWDSEGHMEDHVRSDLYRRVLAAIELSKPLPEIKFYYATQTKGFEVVEALRGSAKERPCLSGRK